MKKVLTKLIAFGSIGLLVLSACKKSGVEAVSNGGKAGALTASATTLPLNKAQVNDTTTVISFKFAAPSYGFAAAPVNTLQIDVPGDNWANPTSFTLGTRVYSQGFSTPTFNNLVLKLNLPAGTASSVEVRVMSRLSAEVAPIYTNVVSLMVTPFNLTSWVYVPGQYEGWSFPGKAADSLISATGNGVYVGIINFTAGNNQFLIVPAQSWSNKWATNASVPSTGAASYPVTYNGSNNFAAPSTAGYYLVTLNTNNNTLTIVPADYYSVIGDAAMGWNPGDDVAMKYLNDGSGNWVVTTALSSSGSFKIRQDDAWTWSWGIPNSGQAGAGVANTLNDTQNSNIPVATSGNYTVTFNAFATAFGATPPVTTTYSSVKQ